MANTTLRSKWHRQQSPKPPEVNCDSRSPHLCGVPGEGGEGCAERIPTMSNTLSNCELCGHSLEDNEHGFDQGDAEMDGDELIHSGRCTYCRECNPYVRKARNVIENKPAERRWEHTGAGWWVRDELTRVGPFHTQDAAREWFRRVLGEELVVVKDAKENTHENGQ